ncbi:MAG TPA: MFS transporter [Micropepsaceae bacterium]|nr:MFS transporter [Micropepsaceae bacterium]
MTANASSEAGGTRGRIAWVLFEWGRNPYVTVITVFIYATYFTRDIVGDPVRGQALWAAIQGYAGLVVAVLAPFLGAIADAGGRRKPWVAGFSVLFALATAALWFGRPGGEGLGLAGIGVLVALANLAYDGSLVFHGAMLPSLVPAPKIGRWSGLGYALGNLAGIVLLLFVLVFIYLPAQPLFGLDRATHEHERISGPLCALWFAVFSLPFFLWTPDRQSTRLPLGEAVWRGLSSVSRTVKSLNHYRNVAAYLGARMIYNDALNVMLSFGGVYAAGVFHWGPVESALYGIILLVCAAAGGLLGGRLADRIGTKRALQLSIGGTMAAALLSLGFAPDRLFFVLPYRPGTRVAALPVFGTAPELFYIGCVMGIALCLVATYANSRAMMARIAPEARMTEFFGLYALSGEATAFMAPLAVAYATQATGSQQWGMAVIVAFLAVGFVGLSFVRETRAAPV